jgi:hypothetical protein
VQSWQSKLFLAEITVYNWQHKMGGWLFSRNHSAQLAKQDSGLF